MRNIKYFKLTGLFIVAAAIFFVACTKEFSDVRLDANLATSQVLDLKSDSATVVGFVVASGSGFTEKGVCYDIAAAPTTDKSKVIYTEDGTTATFNVTLAGLNYATKYYARAYGISSNGTVYGEEITFTTLPVLATVITGLFTPTTGVSATGSSEVTNDGGATVTARGVCYGTEANPVIGGLHTSDGNGLGEFTSSLTKLTGETLYHVRAYAKNSAGVAYGADTTFTTPIAIQTWYLPGDYIDGNYPAPYANWSPGVNSPYVQSTLAAGNLLEGYVYMANVNNNWKFASQPNWNGPNYANNDAGGTITPGTLHADAKDNIASGMGYYKLNVNSTTLTYTQLLTTWGIIGNATPGGWSADSPMTYYPSTMVWGVGAALSIQSPPNDGLKFRANGNWNLNYGDTGADGVLENGGDNIGVAVAGDYAVTLNLSQPNHYTYSLNRWGLIGSFNGWASSVPLTWDAANQVFTVTLALTNGGFKVRANDNWNLALGGKGSGDTNPDNYTDASTVPLTSDNGKNIGTPDGGSGTYTVTLNPWTYVLKVYSPVAKKKK